MEPERWQRIEQLCHAALEREESQRAAFLQEACAGDEALRREVESLLAYDKQTEQFIEAPALEVAAKALAEDEVGSRRSSEVPRLIGRMISHYRIVEKLGSGGMGEVYRAVRADDQYQKQVAIKLVRAGLDTEFILRRFKNERQILASLGHPNIAGLLDGGTTEDGLPYFVMELIEGQPIDQFCDSHRLPTVERLKLFRTVCSAVYYAHQHLVVHRDLKPGNILVTAEGVPKLLDFGIAKILDPEHFPERVEPTATVLRLMTPEYASPEQLRGEAITTASDVYSLGVVLYHLLTGHLPYRLASRSPHEIAQAICEIEPEKPSIAISPIEEVPGPDGRRVRLAPEFVSRTRDGQPDKLRRRLAGDLDQIVLKAIRKEPERRYTSVEQFSGDMRRHLEGRPVVARKGTLGYRSAKFVRRHKAGVIAAGLVALTLIAGMVATLRESRIARAQRARAERRFNDVHKLANSLMLGVHDAIQNLPGSTPARQLLVKNALQYLDSLAQEAGGDLSLRRELAAGYTKLGDVQGNVFRSNLGDISGAVESYRRAVKLRQAIVAADPLNVQARRELASSYDDLGSTLSVAGDRAGAEEHERKSIQISEALTATDPTNMNFRRDLARGYQQLGRILVGRNDLAGAMEYRLKALALFQRVVDAEPNNQADRRSLSFAHKNVGGLLIVEGKLSEAFDHYRAALAIDEALLAANSNDVRARYDITFTYSDIGYIFWKRGERALALMNYRQALAIREALSAADPRDAKALSGVASTYTYIGRILLEKGDTQGAIAAHRKALALREALAAADPSSTHMHFGLAETQGQLGLTYAALAAKSDAVGRKRLSVWRQARAWLQRSLPVYLDRKARGALVGDEVDDLEKISRALAKCTATIPKLEGSPDGS